MPQSLRERMPELWKTIIKNVEHIEMIRVLKFSSVDMSSERRWDTFISWPIDTSSPAPKLVGSNKISGLPEDQTLPRWTLLWGYIKNIVYGEKIRDIRHLRDRITAVIATVTPVMIQRIWHEIEYGVDICRAINGAHFETYWDKTKTSDIS
jgi:hypothetical protein